MVYDPNLPGNGGDIVVTVDGVEIDVTADEVKRIIHMIDPHEEGHWGVYQLKPQYARDDFDSILPIDDIEGPDAKRNAESAVRDQGMGL